MIRIEGLSGLPEKRRRFAVVASRLADFQNLHLSAGSALRSWVRRNYDAQGALLAELPAGWPPLARATLLSRRRRGRSSAILQDSGKLRAGTELTVDARQVVLDNPVPYAARHQLGRGVPRRPIFPGTGQAREIVLPALVRHVEEILG